MRKTTVNRYVVVLCSATPIYLAAPSREAKGAITRVKDDACMFDTFDAAMEVSKRITGWGGAQRIEQIAVEVEDTRSTIATDDDLYEIRDAATAAYTEAEGDSYSRACAVEGALRDLGLLCRTNGDLDGEGSVVVYVTDHLGNTAQFDWDPMQDGFDITEATCLADDGPRRHDDGKQVRYSNCSRVVCNNLAPRFVDAEAGTEPIFKALLGLTTEQKIAALANALLAAQTTICRVEEDGHPIIRAILPNYHPHFGTVTVLNI